jgi:Flp pilus assembly pilin Flp
LRTAARRAGGAAAGRRRPPGPDAAGRDEAGQATVEFALLLPLIVFAALALIQVGLLVRDYVGVQHAAREAARAASVDPDPGGAARAAHRTLPGARVQVGARPRVGEPITVEVSYHAVTNVPLVGALFPDPTIHARAVMRVER